MFQRIIVITYLFLGLQIDAYSACKPLTYNMKYPDPKTAGMIFIDNGKYKTREQASAAAISAGTALSEEDLCYGYATKWGSQKFIEKGTRLGWCRIELFGDLTFKAFRTFNPANANGTGGPVDDMRNEESKDIFDRRVGINWPMQNCTVIPPKCADGFTAFRLSNLMANTTSAGLINGDKTSIIQNWTCIKI